MITRNDLFNRIENNTPWTPPCTFDRLNPIPLEKYSVFESLVDAQNYALANAIAYPGQPIAVINTDNSIKFYLTSTYVVDFSARIDKPEDAATLTFEQKVALLT